MKTVTDKNIVGTAAQSRRQAFEKANDLKSMSNANLIIEGVIYDRIAPRLKEEHKKTFESFYTIDNTGKNTPDYNIISTINFIAKREAKVDCVIILTENVSRHAVAGHKRIVAINPIDFIAKMVKFNKLYESYLDYLKANPQAKIYKSQTLDGLIEEIFFVEELV